MPSISAIVIAIRVGNASAFRIGALAGRMGATLAGSPQASQLTALCSSGVTLPISPSHPVTRQKLRRTVACG